MKKGQAAMEFLMTYGWAILVVIAAIAALAYFGVLNPQNWLPEKCEFPPNGLTCLGKTASLTNGVTISLRNSVSGMPITVSDATLAECTGSAEIAVGLSSNTFAAIANTTVPANEAFKLQWDTCPGLVAGRYDGAPVITYTSQVDGLTKSDTGSIKAKVA
ncbi:MAG: hypothetical protein HGA85_00705 [Nanoarchaeota archaeon]|nr:hypothetical protein [Nanoarchaeota archaeon]